ncbi:MAG: DUF4129 domain-containing protein [Prochlorothrix sp.]
MIQGDYQRNSPGWQWEQTLRRLGESWDRFWQNLGDRDLNLPDITPWSPPEWILRGLFALILGGTLGWLAWHLWTRLWPRWQQWMRSRQAQTAMQFHPPAPQRRRQQWLEQAQRSQRQGDYHAACRALYFAFLQWLADRPDSDRIPADPSRTDGEYHQLLSQPWLQPDRSAPVAPSRSRPPAHPGGPLLLQTHERLCFSRDSLTEADYQACAQAYRQATEEDLE